MTARLALVMAAAAAALAAAAPPAAAGTPERVAVVAGAKCSADGTCADGVVTGRRYRHWLRIVRIATDRRGEPEIASGLREDVMQHLISGWWVRGEAARLEIVVTARQVRRAFRRWRARNFDSRREFRIYRRRTRHTVRDFKYHTRNYLLSKAIRQHVAAPAGDDADERKRLLAEHKRDYRERWTAVTRCARRYRTISCAG